MSGYILGRRSRGERRIGFATHRSEESNEVITYSGERHLVTFGPTGTGKTSGPIITNALKHQGQLIVLDMKGEIYDDTADARRAMGQEVLVLDLRDDPEEGGSLNPLDLARRCGNEPAAIARSFAAEVVERSDHEIERFWLDWAETLIAGACAWMLDDLGEDERKLSWMFNLFNSDDVVYQLAVYLDGKGKQVKNRAAYAAFVSFLALPEKETRPSVLGTVQSYLRLFDSDLTRRLTDTSSIDIDALIAGKPMSLYIIVPPYRLSAYKPLLRMWLSSLILAMTRREKVPEERTLLICDEVGNLGRMEALLTATTLLRSSGLTLWTFWQNADQLQIYGRQANTIIDNAGVIQIFGVQNYRMAQDFANLIGGISPDELMRLKPDEQVLLMQGKIVRCKQVRHYEDQMFRRAV